MNIFKVIAIIVISGVVLLTVLIIYSLAPTINDVSDEAPLKSYLNTPLTLKKTSYIIKVDKGQYDFLEHILVNDSTYPGTKVAVLNIGSAITINQFKTYTNNLGSGFTHLYAIGDILTNGKKINFEYNLGTVDKALYSGDSYKLNYTAWQDSTDIQIDLTKNRMSISENILHLKNTLPKTVTLIAVSKTKPNEAILEAYNTDHRDFGENYVQELVDKHEQLPKDINWHFIGHLQSNKVKFIAPFVYLIHGVDSFSLLKEINKQALKNNRIINCLMQIYIAQEETKFGLSFSEAEAILKSEELKSLKNVAIKGFMAMASNTDDEVQIKNEFQSLNKFKIQNSKFKILSFGMSSDYKLAIEEGSTMVRIGSCIFGERNYTKT